MTKQINRVKLFRNATALSSGTVGDLAPRMDYDFARRLEDRKDLPRGTGEAIASALNRSKPEITRMSRYAERMNGIASHAVDVLESYVIGSGLKPSIPDDDADLMRLWKTWGRAAGAEGVGDISMVQRIAFREWVVGGEAFGILRYRKGASAQDLAVPLQIQVIPTEMVPLRTPFAQSATDGILYDNAGSPAGYYVYKVHPGDTLDATEAYKKETIKFRPQLVAHLFTPREAGQLRGEPWLTRALIKIHDLEKYLGADLLRKILSANIAYWLELPDLTPEEKEELRDISYDPTSGKYFNSLNQEVQPPKEESLVAAKDGSVAVVPPGGKINVTAPAESGNSFSPFIRQIALHIAAALNIPLEFLFGDMSGVNDRLFRAVSSQFERHVRTVRGTFSQRFLNPIWNAFVRISVAEGKWKVPHGRTIEEFLNPEWVGQPFPYLHKLQEVQSWDLEVEKGFSTHSDIIRQKGDDPERVRREKLDDLIKDIEGGLSPIPDYWTDAMIRRHLGWKDAEISEYRSRTGGNLTG
ncbi:phage portal protein [Thioclava sediminum]|uniref:Phage portal protein n=1 Tax=Thioclava sediminum TaxID=1915319 RepID=A0ABX3MS19_9RHOB|nr:phage portal protein [Thioclava sediminum]OOY22497.1 phage portal protein [Thioclava sediminum]